jgi:hypothetical protein
MQAKINEIPTPMFKNKPTFWGFLRISLLNKIMISIMTCGRGKTLKICVKNDLISWQCFWTAWLNASTVFRTT